MRKGSGQLFWGRAPAWAAETRKGSGQLVLGACPGLGGVTRRRAAEGHGPAWRLILMAAAWASDEASGGHEQWNE
jgi:hypothetical protein